jgi:hypothetical protein
VRGGRIEAFDEAVSLRFIRRERFGRKSDKRSLVGVAGAVGADCQGPLRATAVPGRDMHRQCQTPRMDSTVHVAVRGGKNTRTKAEAG